jgi:alpha-glucosidase
LMINFHGATLPTGIQRTWPQVVSYEAVLGEEATRNAQHNATLPFTRNVVGSMDYTPVTFNNGQTSNAHEVALTVLYESGQQHPSDDPGAFNSQPAAENFLANVPTVWDDTRYVSGFPGDTAVIARRSGSNWYIGGITSGSASTMQVPLSVLGSGSWLIDLVTDQGSSVSHQTVTRTSADTLSVPVVQHGGFALEACPATAGRTTCYQRVPTAPGTSGSVVSGVGNKCLDNDNSNANGTPAIIWDCNGGANQKWTLTNGTLQNNGTCLDVTGNATANGTLVEQWQCNGGANQRWTSQNGTLVSAASGRCLDVPGGSTTNGVQLIIWDCNGGSNQRWTFQ